MSAQDRDDPSAPPRYAAVDGLRTVAVLVVVAFHRFPAWVPGGALGVDLFFVVSGFVITGTLLAERAATGRIDLRAFYLRRWFRLTPLLVLVGGVVLAASWVFPHSALAGQRLSAVFAMTYTMNLARGLGWVDESSLRAMGHTWSLGIEEQFYVVWPLLLLALLAVPRRARPLLWGALLLVPTVIRASVWAPEATFRIYNLPDTRFDQLLVGAALAHLLARGAHDGVRRWARLLFWPAAAALAAAVLLVDVGRPDQWAVQAGSVVGFLVVAVLGAVVLAVLVLDPQAPVSRLLGSRLVSTVGRRYSYGIYLWHYVVFYVVGSSGLGGLPGLAVEATALPLVVYLGHRFVERPALRRKRRFEVPRTRPEPRVPVPSG